MPKAKNQKKAFTLTELLVVVIVIGVLSAAVLPKFSKIIETRKTTEAEELMASIRTEQEKRCALDKPYITELSDMTDIVKKKETKNYLLTLQEKGVIASSKGNYSYNLQMPSYADGRVCCDGDGCGNLNKNYPSCTELKGKGDYQPSPDSCAGEVKSVEPEVKSCSGSSTQSCGCQNKGTQSRTCNTTTGEWSAWGACSVSESCECTGEKKDKQACTCGYETRSATCDTETGEWVYGAWSGCAAKPDTTQSCKSGTGTQTRTVVCNSNGEWETGAWTGECDDCVPGRVSANNYSGPDTCDGDSTNKFSGTGRFGTGKFECYDVYTVSSGGSSSSGGCYDDPYHPLQCPFWQEKRCINGSYMCITPCPSGGCAGGTTNPAVDDTRLDDSSLALVQTDKVTICEQKVEYLDGPVLDTGKGCTKAGQSCAWEGWAGTGVWVTDMNNACCCEPVCSKVPPGVACVKACIYLGGNAIF